MQTATIINAINLVLLVLLVVAEIGVLVWCKRRKEITYLTSKTNRVTMGIVIATTVLGILLVMNNSVIPLGRFKDSRANIINLLNQIFGDILVVALLMTIARFHSNQIIQLCKTKISYPSVETCNTCQSILTFLGILSLLLIAIPKIVFNTLTRNSKGDATKVWKANKIFNYIWDIVSGANMLCILGFAFIFSIVFYRHRQSSSRYYVRRLTLLNLMVGCFAVYIVARLAVRAAEYGMFMQKLLVATDAIWPFSAIKLFEFITLLCITVIVGPMCNRTVDLGMGEKSILIHPAQTTTSSSIYTSA
jgi:hypothetical protein